MLSFQVGLLRYQLISLHFFKSPKTLSFLMQNKVLSKLMIFILFTVIYTVNNKTPARCSSRENKQQKSWSNRSGHMFSFTVPKVINTGTQNGYTEHLEKHPISMEMGVDGIDGKCGCNRARVRLKKLKPNQGQ